MKSLKYILLLILLAIVYLFLINSNYPVDRSTLTVIGGIGLFQLAVSFMSWNAIGKSFLSPYFIFLIVLYIFSFGQSLLYPFGLISEKRDLYEVYTSVYGFTVKDIYYAQLQTLLMLNAFHIAGLCNSTKKTITVR